MSGVCLNTATGVGVYSLDLQQKWNPLFGRHKVKVQLFQSHTLVFQPENSEDCEKVTMVLNDSSTVQRHELDTHARYAEITHDNNVYLLKFREEAHCSQFVVKARKFINPIQSAPKDPSDPSTFTNTDGRKYVSTGGHQESSTSGHDTPRTETSWQEQASSTSHRNPPRIDPHNQRRHERASEEIEYSPGPRHHAGYGPSVTPHGEDAVPPHQQAARPGPRNQESQDRWSSARTQPGPAVSPFDPNRYAPNIDSSSRGPQEPSRHIEEGTAFDWDTRHSGHSTNTKPRDQGAAKEAISINRSPNDLKALTDALNMAIYSQDRNDGSKILDSLRKYAEKFDGLRVCCEVNEEVEPAVKVQGIRLNVTVESQGMDSSPKEISVQASRKWKVEDLKARVEQQCLLPRQVQRWIFGKTLVKDSDVIEDLVGDVDHCRPFMYVVKAKKVNLDRLIYQNYKERMGDQQREQEENRVSEPTNAMSYQSSVPRSEYLYTDTGPAYAPSTVHSAPTHGRDVHCSDSRAQKDSPLQAQSRPKDQSSMANRPPQVASPDSWGSQPVRPMYSEEPEFEEDRPTAHQTHRPVDVEPAHPPIYGLDIPINSPPPIKEEGLGWECPNCTFLNKPLRPGCEMCTADRPDSYRIPENYHPDETEKQLMMKIQEDHQAAEATRKEQQEAKKKTWEDLLATDFKDYIENQDDFECPTCLTDYGPGEGIVLRNCLHTVCKDCFKGICINSEEAQVACPYADADYQCDGFVTEREMRGLLTEEEFLKIEEKGLSKAEGALPNTFHCRTADCKGWCQYEDEVNEFACVLCKSVNCLVCKAIHQGMNCKEYQDDINRLAANDEAARATKDFMERMVAEGQAMLCPSCGVVVQKKEGCDWIRCSVCKTELCWATKGRRWGPKGKGDITGGCKCNIPRGQKCHPQCGNCH